MEQVKITKRKSGKIIHIGIKPENYDNWLQENIASEAWGRPEREVISLSESYDPEDIISSRTQDVFGVIKDYILLKADYLIEVSDVTQEFNDEQKLNDDILSGEKIENCCKGINKLIAGYLNRKNLSKEQEDIFDLSFSKIFTAIDRLKIKKTRKLIEDLATDGQIITDKLKENCLSILTKNNF